MLYARRPLFDPCVSSPRSTIYIQSLIQHVYPLLASQVALISNNRIEWAVIFYATASVGGALVPMYEAQMEKDWRYIIADR